MKAKSNAKVKTIKTFGKKDLKLVNGENVNVVSSRKLKL